MPPGPNLPSPNATWVNLAPFWTAMQAIQDESLQIDSYRSAAEFWESYDAKLIGSKDRILALRVDMEVNGQWTNTDGQGTAQPTAASTAFYRRINDGVASIDNWLAGGTAKVRTSFRQLADRLPKDFAELDANRRWLLSRTKLVPGIGADQAAPITPQDQWVRIPNAELDQVRSVVENAEQRHVDLTGLFGQLKADLDMLPEAQRWAGPTTTTAPPAVPPGGPNPAAPGPGGPGTGPGGPGAGPGGPGAGPGGPGAGPGGPGAAGPDAAGPGGPGAATPQSTTDTGGGPGAEQPGAEVPAGLDPATGPAGDPGTTSLPPTDPALAGVPTATAPPTTSSPGTTTSPLPGTVPNIPTGGGPGASSPVSPVPLTPLGGSPVPSQFSSTARPGGEPLPTGPRSSTVDASRGGMPTGGAPGASPVPRGGLVSSGSGPGNGFGPGFYPPMVPPIGAGAGAGTGGIKPGEADFAGGPVRRVGGRDSWRAGLRPQLLGRGGDHDDEPDRRPPERPLPTGDVLDEELWQVPDAAPVSPPESQARRGRSWGPG